MSKKDLREILTDPKTVVAHYNSIAKGLEKYLIRKQAIEDGKLLLDAFRILLNQTEELRDIVKDAHRTGFMTDDDVRQKLKLTQEEHERILEEEEV